MSNIYLIGGPNGAGKTTAAMELRMEAGKRRKPIDKVEAARLRALVEAGIERGVAKALEEHRRMGRKVAIWRDGRVVLIDPDPPENANGSQAG